MAAVHKNMPRRAMISEKTRKMKEVQKDRTPHELAGAHPPELSIEQIIARFLTQSQMRARQESEDDDPLDDEDDEDDLTEYQVADYAAGGLLEEEESSEPASARGGQSSKPESEEAQDGDVS
jgi:hypothetical protein